MGLIHWNLGIVAGERIDLHFSDDGSFKPQVNEFIFILRKADIECDPKKKVVLSFSQKKRPFLFWNRKETVSANLINQVPDP